MRFIITILLTIMFALSLQSQFEEVKIVYDRVDVWEESENRYYIYRENAEFNVIYNYNNIEDCIHIDIDGAKVVYPRFSKATTEENRKKWMTWNQETNVTSMVVWIDDGDMLILIIGNMTFRFVQTK